MPLDNGMGLDWEASKMDDCAETRARVSEIVVRGFDDSNATKDSIAAIAGVSFGSLLVRFL